MTSFAAATLSAADALAQVEFTDMHKELAKVAVGFLQNVRTLKGGVTRQ